MDIGKHGGEPAKLVADSTIICAASIAAGEEIFIVIWRFREW